MVRLVGFLAVVFLCQGVAQGTTFKPKPNKHRAKIALSQIRWDGSYSTYSSQRKLPLFLQWNSKGLPSLSQPTAETPVTQLKTETDYRNGIARKLVREKLETLVKTEVTHWFKTYMGKVFIHPSSVVQNLEQKLYKANNIALFESESSSPHNPKKNFCRVNLGIDFKSTPSKLEYIDEDLELGLYHSRTLSALSGSEPFTQNLTFRFNKKWEEHKLKASFDFPLELPYYRASLSREFSTSLSSTISAQSPIRGTQTARKFEIRVAFLF